jgi:hypothetical protein
VLSFLYGDFYRFADNLKVLHLGLTFALLAVIFGHISGVMIETIRHKTGIITAMFTGIKFSDEAEIPLPTGGLLKTVSFAWIIAIFPTVIYLISSMETKQPLNLTIPAIYKKECAACHMAFPPNALPAKSWKTMMENLQGHFGEDASMMKPRNRGIFVEKFRGALSERRRSN